MDWMRDVVDDALRKAGSQLRKYLGEFNLVDIDISLVEDFDVIVDNGVVKIAFEWEYDDVRLHLVENAVVAKYVSDGIYIAKVLFLPFKARLKKWHLKNGVIYVELSPEVKPRSSGRGGGPSS